MREREAIEAAEFAEMRLEEEKYLEEAAATPSRSFDSWYMSGDACPTCGDNMVTVVHAIEDCGELVVTSEETLCLFCNGFE